MGIITVLWEKWVEFRRDFYKITVAAMISPLMYLIIFGMGIQTTSHGEPYLHFLIPGVVSMATALREGTGSGDGIADSAVAVYSRADHRREFAGNVRGRRNSSADRPDPHGSDL